MKRIVSIVLAVALTAALMLSLSLTAASAELEIGTGTVHAQGGLMLREKATRYSPVIGVAQDGEQITVVSKTGDWYQVRYKEKIGYIHSDYIHEEIQPETRLIEGILDSKVTNLRSDRSLGSSVIDQISAGEKVEILGMEDGWYQVRYGEDEGFIRGDLISLAEKPGRNYGSVTKAAPDPCIVVPARGLGDEIAAYAQGFVGCPYVYGGTSPSGFDCSGFMQFLFRQYGISINRTATAQLADGYAVSYDEMRPGDIVYFGYGNTASHVGMYIGGGNFVHAENYGTGVVITSLSQSYYANRFLCAHRIVG